MTPLDNRNQRVPPAHDATAPSRHAHPHPPRTGNFGLLALLQSAEAKIKANEVLRRQAAATELRGALAGGVAAYSSQDLGQVMDGVSSACCVPCDTRVCVRDARGKSPSIDTRARRTTKGWNRLIELSPYGVPRAWHGRD